VQIIFRQGKEFGEGSVTAVDSDYRPLRAMFLIAAPASFTFPAGHEYLAGDTLADQSAFFRRDDRTDELVAEYTVKIHVTLEDHEIRGADARHINLDDDLALPGPGLSGIDQLGRISIEEYRFHSNTSRKPAMAIRHSQVFPIIYLSRS
jgi:hypothetical protein